MRMKFVFPYAPTTRYRWYHRFGNGFTLRAGPLALHIWSPCDGR